MSIWTPKARRCDHEALIRAIVEDLAVIERKAQAARVHWAVNDAMEAARRQFAPREIRFGSLAAEERSPGLVISVNSTGEADPEAVRAMRSHFQSTSTDAPRL